MRMHHDLRAQRGFTVSLILREAKTAAAAATGEKKTLGLACAEENPHGGR